MSRATTPGARAPQDAQIKPLVGLVRTSWIAAVIIAIAGVVTEALWFVELPIAIGLGAALGAAGWLVRSAVLKGITRRSARIVERAYANQHPLRQAMQARLRALTEDNTELVVSDDAAVSAATHFVGDHHVVEVPIGFLKRYAPQRRRLGAVPPVSADAVLPGAVEVLLAHESGHVRTRDPEVYTRLLANLLAATFCSAVAAAAVLAAAAAGNADYLLERLTYAVGYVPLSVLGWFAIVVFSELRADAHAARVCDPPAVEQFLAEQIAGRQEEGAQTPSVTRLTARLIRFLLHPDLGWRQGLPALRNDVGMRPWIFATLAVAAASSVIQLVPAALGLGADLGYLAKVLLVIPFGYFPLVAIFWSTSAPGTPPTRFVRRQVGLAAIAGAANAANIWMGTYADPNVGYIAAVGFVLSVLAWTVALFSRLVLPRRQRPSFVLAIILGAFVVLPIGLWMEFGADFMVAPLSSLLVDLGARPDDPIVGVVNVFNVVGVPALAVLMSSLIAAFIIGRRNRAIADG